MFPPIYFNPGAVRWWRHRAYMAGINICAQAFGPALSGRRHNWRWRKRENEPWFSATPLWGLELGWDATVPSGIVELPFLNMLTRFTTSSALYGRRQNQQTYYNILFQRTAPGLIKNCTKTKIHTQNIFRNFLWIILSSNKCRVKNVWKWV